MSSYTRTESLKIPLAPLNLSQTIETLHAQAAAQAQHCLFHATAATASILQQGLQGTCATVDSDSPAELGTFFTTADVLHTQLAKRRAVDFHMTASSLQARASRALKGQPSFALRKAGQARHEGPAVLAEENRIPAILVFQVSLEHPTIARWHQQLYLCTGQHYREFQTYGTEYLQEAFIPQHDITPETDGLLLTHVLVHPQDATNVQAQLEHSLWRERPVSVLHVSDLPHSLQPPASPSQPPLVSTPVRLGHRLTRPAENSHA